MGIKFNRGFRWARRIALCLVVLVLVAIGVGWWLLRGSLPVLDGELTLKGLSAPVTIQRDHLGVVTIDAANEADAVRTLGFVHAQERFFEMDLMRRTAAGELSELFGPIALETDKEHRVHRMRARAEDILTGLHVDELALLKHYESGVNAGLSDLRARPWPYLLLRQTPRHWSTVDSMLAGYAMYFDLQDDEFDRALGMLRLKHHLPDAAYELLSRDGTRWDAPLFGRARQDATLPGQDRLDLRTLPAPETSKPAPLLPAMMPGSNNFAVAGKLTQDGRAIIADDMHLGLRAPNIWFRARLRYGDPRSPNGKTEVQGFTLPGLPAVIVGGNGKVAWGFTNGYTANILLRSYCPVENSFDDLCKEWQERSIESHVEKIRVNGAEDATMTVRWLGVHGPVLEVDHDGHAIAADWIVQRRDSLSLDLLRMSRISGLAEIEEQPIRGLPAQNMLAGDEEGRIGWWLSGNVPQQQPDGCDPTIPGDKTPRPMRVYKAGTGTPTTTGREPLDSEDARRGCRLDMTPDSSKPRLVSPASGRLWTANNRTLDGVALQRVGNGGYDLGARAKQIRDRLFAKDRFTEKDLLAIQLDDRALFLQRWWQLLQDESKRSSSPALDALATAARDWQGRATTESASYRIVRAWRLAVHARLVDGLTAPAQVALKDEFELPKLPQFEGVAWPLVTQRPVHLLSRRYANWDDLFEDAAREVHDQLGTVGALPERTWGERNTAAICHPLSGAIPFGKRLLCMPPDQLPGDANMPRVQGPAFGASQRMVVSPGHEEDGIIHMPGGQSGHPLSPFWGAGHDDWVHGRPTPFLPGKAEHTLTFVPAR